MPRQPQWYQHLPHAIEQLRRFPAPVVDRAAVEQLLGVSRRDAIRLLHRFGGYQAGRTFLLGREELIAALEALQQTEAVQWENRRRQRLADRLETTHRDWRARQVKLPVAVQATPASSLPAGMRLRPGVLEVEFGSAEDLLGRLFELVRFAAADLERFEALLGVRRERECC